MYISPPTSSIRFVAGIDEAGRGPLAGPVAVGLVVTPFQERERVEERLFGIRDSKKLSPQKRDRWVHVAMLLREEGLIDYTVSLVGAKYIDERGIVPAVGLAIKRSLLRLRVEKEGTHMLLDGGLRAPRAYRSQETIIRGDSKEPLIALASNLAKVRRDKYMTRLAERHPQYGFERHKGYGTAEHMRSIRRHGISVVHREGFVHL